jgi:hypothetical protein
MQKSKKNQCKYAKIGRGLGLGESEPGLAACGLRDCTMGRGREVTGWRSRKEPTAVAADGVAG